MLTCMDPRSNHEYLTFISDHLDRFIHTFEQFMDFHVENIGPSSVTRGLAPAVYIHEDADEGRVAELTKELNLLAGTLMDLSNLTDVRMAVEGVGAVDPFVNWNTILQPKPLLEASNVRACLAQASGRIEGLKAKAKALHAPEADATSLHPLVWAAARRLWRDGHFRHAVTAAAEAVTGQMKQLTDRNDSTDTALWQEAFSDKAPVEGKPRLRWPGQADDVNVKNMNAGLRLFAPGVNMIIRNTATHRDEYLDANNAHERLATLSLLARLVDACSLESNSDVIRNPASERK